MLSCIAINFHKTVLCSTIQTYSSFRRYQECSANEEQSDRLRLHKPPDRFSEKNVSFRVADAKLLRGDIEAVRSIMADLGWSFGQIVQWLADFKGKKKAAATLLEKEGRRDTGGESVKCILLLIMCCVSERVLASVPKKVLVTYRLQI